MDSDWGAGMELLDIRTALTRIRLEYTQMPEMRLSRSQVQRLLNLPADACEVGLAALIHSRFLVQDSEGFYRRAQPVPTSVASGFSRTTTPHPAPRTSHL